MAKAITGASTSICGEPHADLCPETGHNAGHRCERPAQHDDGMRHPYHECACERRWMGGVPLPKIERATVVEVQLGDTLVFETSHRMDNQEFETFQSCLREGVPDGVQVMVLDGARFAGVIRDADVASEGAHGTEPAPCGHEWPSSAWCRRGHGTRSHHQCDVLSTATDKRHRCACGEQL